MNRQLYLYECKKCESVFQNKRLVCTFCGHTEIDIISNLRLKGDIN